MPAINDVLQQGRYRIIQQFGQDVTGAFYEAYDTVSGANVVVKEIPVKLQKIATVSQREMVKTAFVSEAKLLSEVRHDSFLQVHDYFDDIDRQYLVIEQLDGNDLRELLEKNQAPFELSLVTGWADQLLDALHHLHTQNPPVIHRDIKPANLKLTPDGRIKLLAFGVAKNTAAKYGAALVSNKNFDAASLPYLPLEQIWQGLDAASRKVILNSYDEKSERVLLQPTDARTDVYAIGATIYHLLTGRAPVDALERSIEILEEKPDPLAPLHELNASIPPEISEVLMRAMEIRRENRYSSAVIMRQVLRTAFVRVKEREAEQANGRISPTPAPPPPATKPAAAATPTVAAKEQNFLKQHREEEQRRYLEQKRLEADAEQKRQAELIRQQEEREAQAQKPIAEVEESILELEAEAADVVAYQAEAVEIAPEVIAPQAIPETPQNIAAVSKSNDSPGQEPTDDFKDMFGGLEKENKSGWRIPVLAFALIALIGVGIGIWAVMSNKAAGGSSTQSETAPTMSINDATAKPEPTTTAATVETAPAPTANAETTMTAAETNQTVPTETGETVVNPADATKNKSAAAPRVKKQTVTPQAGTAAKPAAKKAVTVDDLINDN